jgi:PncC family amidohydrolase
MESETPDRLVERLSALCREKGLTVGTAESCTGGLIAKLLTDMSGSSEFFLGGVVTYSNAAKASLLGVRREELEAHGAVSAQVAVAMAIGARGGIGVDVAVAVTGIAGPTGGSKAKPLGLTYLAVADREGADVRRLVFAGDRASNRESAASAALAFLIERIAALPAHVSDAPESEGR